MKTPAHVTEWLGVYALNALDEAEAEQVRTHLAGCAECQADLASLREVSGRLANLAPQRDPPSHLRRRLLAVFEREARPPRRAGPVARLAQFRWAWVGLAAVFILCQVWLAASLLSLQAQLDQALQVQAILLSSEATPVKLQPPTPTSPARGVYRFEPDLRRGVLSYYQLPPLGPGHAYRCWFEFANGSVADCGRLALGQAGSGVLLITLPAAQPVRLRVTLETAQTARPAGPTILAADLSPDNQ